MFENWLKLVESIYENIDESDALEIIFVICSVLFGALLLLLLMGLCASCFTTRSKSKKKKSYKPTTYFKNSLCKSIEDSIYFSEVSPSSSDSLSTVSVSSASTRQNSTVSVVSAESSKSWFPLTAVHKKFSQKQKAEPPTTVHLYLKFVPSDEKTNQHGKLHISVKNVVSLPTKDYPRYTEAYLIIQLIHVHQGIKSRTEAVISENRTRNFRNTRDIEVDEHFMVDTKKNDWKNWKLVLTAFDQDIYTKPSELASAEILLSRKYKDITSHREGVEITSQLKQTPKNVGNLLIGLSYLPTSQRVSVNIVKAANLPRKKDTKIKMYAQLFLLTGVTGRSLKRKKLLFNTSDDAYELNGTMSFDITPGLLETVTLLIILYEKINEPEKPDLFETIDSARSATHNQDRCYGSVAIGKLVTNHKGKKHWRMMMAAPRRVVTVWHSLK